MNFILCYLIARAEIILSYEEIERFLRDRNLNSLPALYLNLLSLPPGQLEDLWEEKIVPLDEEVVINAVLWLQNSHFKGGHFKTLSEIVALYLNSLEFSKR